MPVIAIELIHREGPDAPGSRHAREALKLTGLDVGGVEHRACYFIEGTLDDAACRAAAAVLADPVLETARIGKAGLLAADGKGAYVTIMRRPGVMDPAEDSVLRAMKDAKLPVEAAKCARVYRLSRALTPDELRRVARTLANEAVEEVHTGDVKLATLKIGREYRFERVNVPLRDLDDAGLKRVSAANKLAMNLAELRAVQAFFRGIEREPTDIELDMIAQTWSEHCKHKTLTGPVIYRESGARGDIDDSLFDLVPGLIPANGRIEGLLQSTIKRATQELDREFCWSVFVDNAGIIDFDGEYGVCAKVETHNHPSAIEPYGGAGTGVGGVIRDILGTGLGAKPLMNTDTFCVGPLDMADAAVPKGALHPRTTLRGVVSGVRDYGNRMGIPTASGGLFFDERYTGNPLVYAGCIGLIPRERVIKESQPGDAIVAVGGRTGRDGIGGATFSSVELTSASETVSSGAVQIGNAIQEKIVLDVLLKARDQNLYNDVTDCGAGGFSSAVGEMGRELGARVELEDAPLKYQGLSYREIWLSEAQERMVFAVPKNKLDRFLALCVSEDLETAVLGEFGNDGRMTVTYGGQTVLDLPMEFLHEGLPKVERNAVWEAPDRALRAKPVTTSCAPAEILRAILASPNVCSREWIIRQYDHEVQAMSALKPLVGARRDGPSDAVALAPRPDGGKALVVASGLNPHYADIDPYWMAQSAIDEAVRNAVAAGCDVDHLAILDNFSWGNCDKPDRMGAMVRACAGCYAAAKALGTPFISGKDSLNNEFATERGVVAIPHTLLITAVGVTEIAWLTSMDLKRAGNRLYVIGLTADEFGGSHYNLVAGESAGEPVRYDPARALACYRALNEAQARGLVRSAHDCSEGGLAVALAEMALAGGLGADVRLSAALAASADAQDDRVLLFSESNARIVVEVEPSNAAKLEAAFGQLPLIPLGDVSASGRLAVHGLGGDALIDEDVNELRRLWRAPLYHWLGESAPE